MTASQILISNTQYFCKKNGIRVQDFEKEIGMSRGHLARYYRMERQIGLDTAVYISKRFGISLDALVSEDIQKQERIVKLERELANLKKE